MQYVCTRQRKVWVYNWIILPAFIIVALDLTLQMRMGWVVPSLLLPSDITKSKTILIIRTQGFILYVVCVRMDVGGRYRGRLREQANLCFGFMSYSWLSLPTEDGSEVCRRIHQHSRYIHVHPSSQRPVIGNDVHKFSTSQEMEQRTRESLSMKQKVAIAELKDEQVQCMYYVQCV